DERENSIRGALEQVLGREGATKSATETLRAEQDTAHSLTTLLPQYDHGRVTVLDPKAIKRAEQAVRDALPADLASRIVDDEAWSTFAARLVDHDLAGTALHDRLQGLVRPRDLDTIDPIESPARVYWWRLGPATTIGTDLEPVDGLPKWVTPFNDRIGDPEVRTWLNGQQELMRDRITSLVDQVVAEPPAWAEPFGQIPTDPAQAERWRENMGRIVAYREAFEVPASEAVLSEEPRGSHAVQAWQDARAAGLDIRTQQDRLAREQASADALERMGIDPTTRTGATATATLPETAVVVDVDRLLEQKPAWVTQYGTQPADGDARDTWREQVATVAAYRDAHGITDTALRLLDPGMVERDTRHEFAAAEQAHEDLRRTGWMRDRDGVERNTPAPSAEPAPVAAEGAREPQRQSDVAQGREPDALEATEQRAAGEPQRAQVSEPEAAPAEKQAADASDALRKLADDPNALAYALRRRQEAAAAARDAAGRAAREAEQQAEAVRRNTYDQSGPRLDQGGLQRHL
ncbi:MAG: hypothetical protein K0S70_62, partial [Microbacterium sp.]|nr:hypothetical protein [Microbacterium sp.]